MRSNYVAGDLGGPFKAGGEAATRCRYTQPPVRSTVEAVEANKVKLAVADLPIDAQLKGNEVTAVPFDNSGVRIGFDLDRAKAATAVLRDADGHPLPAGLALASADGGVKVTVAKNGFAQVDGIGTEPAKVEGAVGSRRFACEIPPPRVAEFLPDLGEVTCR